MRGYRAMQRSSIRSNRFETRGASVLCNVYRGFQRKAITKYHEATTKTSACEQQCLVAHLMWLRYPLSDKPNLESTCVG